MCLFYILLFVTLQCYHITWAEICKIEVPNLDGNATETIEEVETKGGQQSNLLNCPSPGDPPEWIHCCYYEYVGNETEGKMGDVMKKGNGMPRCCPEDEQQYLFNFISDQNALLIAVTVTAVLLLITIVIVICCFWSRCPLYMLCRVRYRQDDIIAYASKDDETVNLNDMPPEEQKGIKVYSPNAVKVTLKDDV